MLLQQEQRQTTTQRIDPKIIIANAILQLSAVELTQSIEAELMENPALDVLDDASCAGDCIDPAACPYCSLRRSPHSDRDPAGETLLSRWVHENRSRLGVRYASELARHF